MRLENSLRIVEPGALTNLESQYLGSFRVINPALDHAFCSLQVL